MHSSLRGRVDVVVAPVPDVQNLVGLEGHGRCHSLEELGVRLARPPVVRRTDQVDVVGEQLSQDSPGPYGLVAGDPEPQSVGSKLPEGGPDVAVQIVFPEALRLPGRGPPLPLRIQVEPGPELLERLPVVTTLGDDGPEHRMKGVPRHTQPVGPGPVLPGLVHEALTDVEDNCANHGGQLSEALSRA